MIVSIHQPHFLPWLNYVNKIAKSDVFVLLEDVQFRRRYYQNRAKVKLNDGELLLTLPLKKSDRDTNIDKIELLKGKEMGKICTTLKMNYSKTPFFNDFYFDIEKILLSEEKMLVDLNDKLLMYILKVLDIDTKIIKSTSLSLKSENPNDRLIEICKNLKATHYIAGKGSRNYMDEEKFQNENIHILWQNYPIDQIVYKQLKKPFVSGLSVLDVLFNIGTEETKKLVHTPWIN